MVDVVTLCGSVLVPLAADPLLLDAEPAEAHPVRGCGGSGAIVLMESLRQPLEE